MGMFFIIQSIAIRASEGLSTAALTAAAVGIGGELLDEAMAMSVLETTTVTGAVLFCALLIGLFWTIIAVIFVSKSFGHVVGEYISRIIFKWNKLNRKINNTDQFMHRDCDLPTS